MDPEYEAMMQELHSGKFDVKPRPAVVVGGVLPLEYQLGVFDATASAVFDECAATFAANKPAVMKAARRRLIDALSQYGDKTWHLTFEEIELEQLAEMADLLDYGVMRRWAMLRDEKL